MTSQISNSRKSFWGKARGDHMLTAAMFTSMVLTVALAVTVFKGHEGLEALIWFFFSGLLGVLIPITLVPEEWINNELPSGHFWRDLMCQ